MTVDKAQDGHLWLSSDLSSIPSLRFSVNKVKNTIGNVTVLNPLEIMTLYKILDSFNSKF